jgi:hypothetical protein
MKRLALCCLLLVLPSMHAAAADELQPFTVRYAWTLKGLSAGTSTVTLKRLTGDRWSYSSRSVARGLFRLIASGDITQDSTMRVIGTQVLPERYRGDDGTGSTGRDVQLDFDWQALRARGIYEDTAVDIAIEPGVHDDMSVQIALILALNKGTPPTGFKLVDRNLFKEYTYSTAGTAQLDTPLGRQQAVLFRSQRIGSKSSTLYWCAPALGFLPIKVERHDANNKVEWAMNMEALTRP